MTVQRVRRRDYKSPDSTRLNFSSQHVQTNGNIVRIAPLSPVYEPNFAKNATQLAVCAANQYEVGQRACCAHAQLTLVVNGSTCSDQFISRGVNDACTTSQRVSTAPGALYNCKSHVRGPCGFSRLEGVGRLGFLSSASVSGSVGVMRRRVLLILTPDDDVMTRRRRRHGRTACAGSDQTDRRLGC